MRLRGLNPTNIVFGDEVEGKKVMRGIEVLPRRVESWELHFLGYKESCFGLVGYGHMGLEDER